MSKAILMTDLTAAATDDLCGRRFWYARLEGGRGIQSKGDVIASHILNESLTDLRTVAAMADTDLSADNMEAAVQELLSGLSEEDKKDRAAMELLYRRLGWLVAYALFEEPYLRRTFETIPIEPEIAFVHDNLFVKMATGRVLQYRIAREVIYRTYVPTSFISGRWRGIWPRTASIHLELKAVEKAIGRKVEAVQVMGLAKGFYSRPGNLGLSHPYVLGYYHAKDNAWTHNYMIGKGEGWRERPVWEYEDGLVNWVMKCGRDVAETQFPLTGHIAFNPSILDGWLAHRVHRERAILGAAADCHGNHFLRNVWFPQNTSACTPMLGDPCPYENLCWGSLREGDSTLASGAFIANTLPPTDSSETIEGAVIA